MLLLTACGAPEQDLQRLPDLLGQVVMSRAGMAVPDHRWQVSDDHWRLDRVAGFVLTTSVTPADEVAVSLTLAGSEEPELELLLDGRTMPTTTGQPGPDGTVMTAHLPGHLLTPGTHVLDVSTEASDPPTFSELALHVGDQRESFRPDSHTYYAYLADFLSLGVAGPSPPPRFGGFLMMGPQKVAVEVPAGARRFVAEVRNVSFATAVFSLGTGRERIVEQVEAGEAVRLELRLDPDRSKAMELEAQGRGDGLFHWSVSRFEDSDVLRRPPLVLISLDTTRRDAVAPWSGDASATPHLAALSEIATVFDSAATTSPWTLPAHASMFTGRYPSRHGAGVFTYDLDRRQATLAQHLSRRGYVTAGFAAGPFTSHLFGLGRGFTQYDEPTGAELTADRITDGALAFLDRHGEDPFFLFVNYFDPHYPWKAPARFSAGIGASGDAFARRLVEGDSGAWNELTLGRVHLGDEALADVMRAYRSEVAFMDEQIGRLFDALESRGLFDRALIVVTADHGELLGDRGFFNHGCRLDPELVRIPMMMKRPGQRHRERIAEPVSVIDVFPTLLAAAGVAPEERELLTSGDSVVLDRDALRRASRRSVHSEEHEVSKLHSFYENMKISPHLLSIEQRDERQVLWSGNALCQRRDGAVWHSRSCAAGNGPGFDELDRFLAGGARESPRLGRLARRQAAKLKALGYLR